MAKIETTLGKLRRKRGLSAIALAATVGVSRQTIYAIEAGTFVPNTVVALHLARALGTTVEELFTLPETVSGAAMRMMQATMLPDAEALQAGQAVQLCRVDRKLMVSAPSLIPWSFPAADAVVAEKPGHEGTSRVNIFQNADFGNRILVAGCDPGISVLSRRMQVAGVELVLAHRNSSQSLALLKAGCVHVAGTHLRNGSSDESNLLEVERLFKKHTVTVITFAVWEEGIVAARGNPKGIKAVEDFARADVVMVNREAGSGSRALLDSERKRIRLRADAMQGYDRLASGHLSAAWQVQTGAADCCIATRAAAQLFGLAFVPLVSERYDLVIRKQHLELPKMQLLLDVLSRSNLRRELEGLGGYDTRVSGQRRL